jgi:hypothetical protein
MRRDRSGLQDPDLADLGFDDEQNLPAHRLDLGNPARQPSI